MIFTKTNLVAEGIFFYHFIKWSECQAFKLDFVEDKHACICRDNLGGKRVVYRTGSHTVIENKADKWK